MSQSKAFKKIYGDDYDDDVRDAKFKRYHNDALQNQHADAAYIRKNKQRRTEIKGDGMEEQLFEDLKQYLKEDEAAAIIQQKHRKQKEIERAERRRQTKKEK